MQSFSLYSFYLPVLVLGLGFWWDTSNPPSWCWYFRFWKTVMLFPSGSPLLPGNMPNYIICASYLLVSLSLLSAGPQRSTRTSLLVAVMLISAAEITLEALMAASLCWLILTEVVSLLSTETVYSYRPFCCISVESWIHKYETWTIIFF